MYQNEESTLLPQNLLKQIENVRKEAQLTRKLEQSAYQPINVLPHSVYNLTFKLQCWPEEAHGYHPEEIYIIPIQRQPLSASQFQPRRPEQQSIKMP